MRSLVKTSSVVREHIDTVRSTGWKMHESAIGETMAIEKIDERASRQQKNCDFEARDTPVALLGCGG